MGLLAFVFSGQGSQYSGMGKELFDGSPAAREIFHKADAIRPGTSEQCFAGTAQELTCTANTQPCIFAMELAAVAALAEAGITPAAVAGFSLGELAALVCAGVVTFDQGMTLVCRRGMLMEEAALTQESAMAAVVGLAPAVLEGLCSQFTAVYPVNYNCPGQIAVAGDKLEMDTFKKTVKEAGGRAIPLRVAGGFHSPFMAKAAADFAPLLAQTPFQTPTIPLYSDYTGLPYEGDPAPLLQAQISNPVRWQSIIEHMVTQGFDTFVEVGPGTTLCGLIGKIAPHVTTLHVENTESLAHTIGEVQKIC